MAKPYFKIILLDDNQQEDITEKFDNRLISMTLVDKNGFQADTITIVIDDSDQKVNLPNRGAKLEITLGWKADKPKTTIDAQEAKIFEANIKNVFTITQVSHSGTPDIITLQGSSANLKDGTALEPQEKSYHNLTLGEIITEIAIRNKLPYRYDKLIGSNFIPHIDQTNESDSSFLTRLINDYGGGVTIKNDMLIVFNKGQGMTVNGKKIPTAKIKRASGDKHSFTFIDTPYLGVKAYWYNYKKPTKKPYKIICKQQIEKSKVHIAKSKPKNLNEKEIKELKYVYANEESATAAAKSELKKIQQGIAQFKLKLALGRPDLFSEMPVEVDGFKPEINSTNWTIASCTHSLSKSSGFTTELELQIKPEEESYENILK